MIFRMIEEIPHFSIDIFEKINDENIILAYEELSTAYNGIKDYISILDKTREGIFNLSEVIIAGLILTEALDGYLYIARKRHKIKAKYIKINNADCIYLVDDKRLFSSFYYEKCTFYAEDGTKYIILASNKR